MVYFSYEITFENQWPSITNYYHAKKIVISFIFYDNNKINCNISCEHSNLHTFCYLVFSSHLFLIVLVCLHTLNASICRWKDTHTHTYAYNHIRCQSHTRTLTNHLWYLRVACWQVPLLIYSNSSRINSFVYKQINKCAKFDYFQFQIPNKQKHEKKWR